MSDCNKKLETYAETVENLLGVCAEEAAKNKELEKSCNTLEGENRKLEGEIVQLKAKLYDLMVGGEK